MSDEAVNPKQEFGNNKVAKSVIPAPVIMELGLAMMEGAIKYGSHNYRDTPILASTYYDAVNRHMDAWWEGENVDPSSGISHVTKAIASLVVLRDAMLFGTFKDNRPKAYPPGWMEAFNSKVVELKQKVGGNADGEPSLFTDLDMQIRNLRK